MKSIFERGEIIRETAIKEYSNPWDNEYKVLMAAYDCDEFIVYTTDDSTKEKQFRDYESAKNFFNSIECRI